MKLKTLKDMVYHAQVIPENSLKTTKPKVKLIIEYDRLKQEVINDIKELRKTSNNPLINVANGIPVFCLSGDKEQESIAIINYIKWKFNITEDDLKEVI